VCRRRSRTTTTSSSRSSSMQVWVGRCSPPVRVVMVRVCCSGQTSGLLLAPCTPTPSTHPALGCVGWGWGFGGGGETSVPSCRFPAQCRIFLRCDGYSLRCPVLVARHQPAHVPGSAQTQWFWQPLISGRCSGKTAGNRYGVGLVRSQQACLTGSRSNRRLIVVCKTCMVVHGRRVGLCAACSASGGSCPLHAHSC
jgi:hypothetical protein